MSTSDPPKLDTAAFARIADLRSRGRSWDFVATDIGWRAIDLTGACYDNPRYDKALDRAKRELRDECRGEAVHHLRMVIRDESDPKRATEAAKYLAEIVAEQEALDVKLKIEQLRCETRLKVEQLRAQRKDQQAKEKEDPADRPLTEKEQQQQNDAFWRGQERVVKEIEEPGAEVYVWGGEHAITDGTPPGSSDTRVLIVRDPSIRDRRIFWATTHPTPADPINGPFLDPLSTA